MKKGAILLSLVLFCLFGFTTHFNFGTTGAKKSVKTTRALLPRIDGEYTICNDGRTYTYTITGLTDPADTAWTWTLSGKEVFSGGLNTGLSVDIMYDPSTEGSYSHGVLKAIRPNNTSLTRHFDVITCP